MKPRIKLAQVLPVEGELRQARYVLSTGDVDRDGDVLDPNGCVSDNYRKNPVVLFAHESDKLPVAKMIAGPTVIGNKLVGTVQFADADMNPLAEQCWQAVKRGFLKAGSVGFAPIEYKPRGDGDGYLFTRWELLEFSIVPVPANADALVTGVKGFAKRRGDEPAPSPFTDGFVSDECRAGACAICGAPDVCRCQCGHRTAAERLSDEQIVAKAMNEFDSITATGANARAVATGGIAVTKERLQEMVDEAFLSYAASGKAPPLDITPDRLKRMVNEAFDKAVSKFGFKGDDFAGTQTGNSSGDLGGDQPYQGPHGEAIQPESQALYDLLVAMFLAMGYTLDGPTDTNALAMAFSMIGGSIKFPPATPIGGDNPATPDSGTVGAPANDGNIGAGSQRSYVDRVKTAGGYNRI